MTTSNWTEQDEINRLKERAFRAECNRLIGEAAKFRSICNRQTSKKFL